MGCSLVIFLLFPESFPGYAQWGEKGIHGRSFLRPTVGRLDDLQ